MGTEGGTEGGRGESHGRTCEAGSGLRWRVGGAGSGASGTDANPYNVSLSCLSICLSAFFSLVSGPRQTEESEHKDTLPLRAAGCAHAGLICSEFIFIFFHLVRKIRIQVKYYPTSGFFLKNKKKNHLFILCYYFHPGRQIENLLPLIVLSFEPPAMGEMKEDDL